jgi:hypothetical protein
MTYSLRSQESRIRSQASADARSLIPDTARFARWEPYLAVLVAFVFCAALALGCGAGTQALVQCKADAVRELPEDIGSVTPNDVIGLYARLRACHRTADAGTP